VTDRTYKLDSGMMNKYQISISNVIFVCYI